MKAPLPDTLSPRERAVCSGGCGWCRARTCGLDVPRLSHTHSFAVRQPRLLPASARTRQTQDAGPGRRHAQTPARHSRHVQKTSTLRRLPPVPPYFNLGSGGARCSRRVPNSKKERKFSCTSFRKKELLNSKRESTCFAEILAFARLRPRT